jgi:hypothetical protein
MTNESKKPVFTKDYELSGNHLFRQFRHWTRMKVSVMGNYDTGPGLKNLITMWLVHRTGRPVYWVRTRLHNLHGLKQKLKSFLPRNQNG